MEDKIIELFEKINFLGYYTTNFQKYDYIKRAKSLIPEIQEFVTWFDSGNQFGIEESDYQALQENLLDILKDCMEAFEQEDRVLLLDALEYGLSEYLKMFLPTDYFEKRNAKNAG